MVTFAGVPFFESTSKLAISLDLVSSPMVSTVAEMGFKIPEILIEDRLSPSS
ncbi:unnamed protein product [Brassica oleracea var. botrytis]|uniref:Uncharacterized protein n=2 Tax=Brassica oleracea TaxID=3712 RepID=A0A0D2ZRH1_BRAOL|nr:unnamed protein product [Brassica oleracea]